jgi:hypothetical protein
VNPAPHRALVGSTSPKATACPRVFVERRLGGSRAARRALLGNRERLSVCGKTTARDDQHVVDDNGEGIIFSGADGVASDNANVYDNLLTGAVLRHDAESWYPAGNPVGTGNQSGR